MTPPATYTLHQLTEFIRRVFALNLPEPVWVAAELVQVNESRGHVWLTLVEKNEAGGELVAQLDAVVWARTYAAIRQKHGTRLIRDILRDGTSVRLRVSASFHERFGLKMVVEDIDPTHTIGLLERQRQRTLERLAADGLLTKNSQLLLPALPLRLAVISSETAAGLADFRRQLEENTYGYRFTTTLFTAAMQGSETSPEVSKRLRQIGRRPSDYDAVVLVRGGGGRTDLAAFDDEALCRAVADCPLPVLVGIGHEIDETLADRVAHASLKTPTAVAVFLIDRLLGAEARLLQLGREIGNRARTQVQSQRNQLEWHRSTLERIATQSTRTEAGRLDHLAALLLALRPETTLARGYALVSQHGKLILDPEQLKAGEVEVLLRGGRVVLLK